MPLEKCIGGNLVHIFLMFVQIVLFPVHCDEMDGAYWAFFGMRGRNLATDVAGDAKLCLEVANIDPDLQI